MRFLAFIVYLTNTSIGAKPSSHSATTTCVSSGANLARKSESAGRHTRKSSRRRSLRVGTTMTFRHGPRGAGRECHYDNTAGVVGGSGSRYYQPAGLEGHYYDHEHDHEHSQVPGYGLCSHGYHNEYNTMYDTYDHEHISFAMRASAPLLPPPPPTQKWKPKPKPTSTLSGWFTGTFPSHATITPHSPTPGNQKTQQPHHRYHRHDAWNSNSHAYHQTNPPHEPIMFTYPPHNHKSHHQDSTHQKKKKKPLPDIEKGKYGTSGHGRGKRVHFEVPPEELAYHSPRAAADRDHADGVGWGKIAKLGK